MCKTPTMKTTKYGLREKKEDLSNWRYTLFTDVNPSQSDL